MALRNQPYLPLYVQDFLTDEKLNECSAESTGVYIRLMCIMHKSEKYGTILLKQKDKQTDKQIKNFANKLVKQMPYSEEVIERSLYELLEEKVITLDGDELLQKRMVNDCILSEKRALAGEKGGKKNAKFAKGFALEFAQAKSKANPENENEYEIETETVNTDKEKTDGNNSAREDEGGESLLVETATGETETAETVSHSLTRKPRKRKDTGNLTKEQQKLFEIFWQAWPNKKSPGQAEVTFAKIDPDDGLLQEILAGIERAKKYDYRFRETRYTPHPSSWLNSRGWEDKFAEGGIVDGEHRSHPPVFTPSTGFQTE